MDLDQFKAFLKKEAITAVREASHPHVSFYKNDIFLAIVPEKMIAEGYTKIAALLEKRLTDV